MSYDPLLRRPMLFWIAGPSAVPPDRCLRSTASGGPAQPHCFPRLVFRLLPQASRPPYPKTDGSRQRPRLLDAGAVVDLIGFIHLMRWSVVQPERLRSCLKHLETMVALSKKSWELILAETDDHNEWIPGPHQTAMLPGLRVAAERVKGWQSFLDEFEAVLQGRKLIPHFRFDKGINVRRLFLEPRTFDPVLLIQGSGAVPYLEDGEKTTADTWQQILELFEGNFLGYFIWFN